jgi:hypothetical protein
MEMSQSLTDVVSLRTCVLRIVWNYTLNKYLTLHATRVVAEGEYMKLIMPVHEVWVVSLCERYNDTFRWRLNLYPNFENHV